MHYIEPLDSISHLSLPPLSISPPSLVISEQCDIFELFTMKGTGDKFVTPCFFGSKSFQKSFSCIDLVGKCGPACLVHPQSFVTYSYVPPGQRVSSGENQPGPPFLTGATKSTYITFEKEILSQYESW